MKTTHTLVLGTALLVLGIIGIYSLVIRPMKVTISTTNETALINALGQHVTLVGEARNAQAGAVIKIGSSIVYIDGLANWEDARLDKEVTANGLLTSQKYIPDPSSDTSLPSSGATGNQFVLKNPVVKDSSN